jgi:hypothetical protein
VEEGNALLHDVVGGPAPRVDDIGARGDARVQRGAGLALVLVAFAQVLVVPDADSLRLASYVLSIAKSESSYL